MGKHHHRSDLRIVSDAEWDAKFERNHGQAARDYYSGGARIRQGSTLQMTGNQAPPKGYFRGLLMGDAKWNADVKFNQFEN